MGRVDRARRRRNAIRRDLRDRGLDASPELAQAEAALGRARAARRARRRQAWRDFVEGLADVLGFADGLLDHLDDEEKLGRVGSAIVAQSGIPIDDLAGGVALAQVLLEVAAGARDEGVSHAAEE